MGVKRVCCSRVSLIPVLVLATACGKSSTAPSGESRTISDFLASVATADSTAASGTPQTGNPPAPAGGPSATATSGGGSIVVIQGSAPFQTIFVSIGSAQSARSSTPDPLYLLAARSVSQLVARLAAATIETSGFMRVDLPAAVTETSLFIGYKAGIPSNNFDMRIQIGAPGGGPAGPIATIHKANFDASLIEIVASVFGTLMVVPGGHIHTPPIAGAVVSTSLDSRTAVTGASGWFDLVTNTPYRPGLCYRITVTAAGYPTYSTEGWSSSLFGPPYILIRLDPPAPPSPGTCN